MTATALQHSPGEYPFTEAHFRQIADLARQRYGLSLQANKKPLVHSRLTRRLRETGIADFDAYLKAIVSGARPDEEIAFVSALTTNVTSFFREAHHFEMLKSRALPRLSAKLAGGGRVRFWSAGCSSGEEPYSLAITLLDHLDGAATGDLRILATDIDHGILERARAGRYPTDAVNTLPQQTRRRHLRPVDTDPDQYEIAPPARDLIRFAELNLMTDWPFKGPFDAIFCRNVAIYFDKETQARLWQRFVDLLDADGLLFIGHSERLSGPALDSLESIGITAYAKRAGQPDPS